MQFGVTIAGEFSTAMNDCGLYLNGVADNASITGDCAFWIDPTQWNQTIIDGLMQYTLASMDALQNWFFWTWKVFYYHYLPIFFNETATDGKHVGWKLECDRHGSITSLVVPARSRRRLDSARPTCRRWDLCRT